MGLLAGTAYQQYGRRLQASGVSALWQRNPEVLREENLPEDFVGVCCRCGRTGHLSRYSDFSRKRVWCEKCYPVVARWMWIKQIAVCALVLALLWGLKYVF